jgi:hypothetical protein
MVCAIIRDGYIAETGLMLYLATSAINTFQCWVAVQLYLHVEATHRGEAI